MNTNEEVSNATPIVVVKNIPAQPVEARVIEMPHMMLPANLSEKLCNIYNLSKTTRFLAAIDIFFALIYCFYNYFFFIAFIVAFSGYYGAKKYNSTYLLIYATYLFLNNISRIGDIAYTIYYYDQNKINDRTNVNTSIVLASIFCLFNIYIARFVCVFWSKIKKMTPHEKDTLILIERENRVSPNYIWRV